MLISQPVFALEVSAEPASFRTCGPYTIRVEEKIMQTSNHFLLSVFILVTGFALGLGAATYFAATGNEGKQTVAEKMLPLVETVEMAKSTVLSTPTKQGSPELATQESVVSNTLSGDISLSEKVDTSRQETATTELTPEELKNRPIERGVMPPLSPQETDELESKLRLESENTASISLEDNETLLQHERL